MTDFYTYVYHDGDTPIYVGKGKEKRVLHHLKRSDKHPLTSKLIQMKREGREPRIQIIDAPDEEAAFEMECLLIAMIGRKDLGLGPLLNLHPGGRGQSHTNETREKIRRGTTGKHLSDETKSKISEAKSGKKMGPQTEEHIKKRIRFGVKKSEHTIEKMRQGLSKPCTVDGITIYPSGKALAKALGKGKAGSAHPHFRYVKV